MCLSLFIAYINIYINVYIYMLIYIDSRNETSVLSLCLGCQSAYVIRR